MDIKGEMYLCFNCLIIIYHYGFSKAGFSLSSAVPTGGYSSGQEKRISGYSRIHAADLTALNYQNDCFNPLYDSIPFSQNYHLFSLFFQIQLANLII